MEKSVTDAINFRRSVRKFDPNKEIDTEIVKKCIENGVLAPTSSNLQLWEFYHITNKDLLRKVSKIQIYRGPDSQGFFESDDKKVLLGNNRLAVIDKENRCHGFGRIRPCLLQNGDGWRIGPLMADTPKLLKILLKKLIESHPGLIIIDAPGLNKSADDVFIKLGFKSESETFRMYRGSQPPVSMNDVYGLACLELG